MEQNRTFLEYLKSDYWILDKKGTNIAFPNELNAVREWFHGGVLLQLIVVM